MKFLHQGAYCRGVLEKFGMDSANPAPMSTVKNVKELLAEGSSNGGGAVSL